MPFKNRLIFIALVLFLSYFFRPIFLDYQVVDDEVLALHGVLTHVVLQEFLHLVSLVEGYLFQSDVGTNEACKFIRRDFTQTFEAGDFGIGT